MLNLFDEHRSDNPEELIKLIKERIDKGL